MNYVRSAIACQRLGCQPETLRRWEARGIIEAIRTSGNQRLYNVEKFIKEKQTKIEPTIPQREKILYCRVSSSKQKEDLERQVGYLSERYPTHTVYKEIASGINFKRKQLYRILDLCFRGMVEEVVVAHKDRLCRIAWDHFEWLFSRLGVRLIFDSDDDKKQSPNEELADDLMSIVHVFSCRHYGQRRRITKKIDVEHKDEIPPETGKDDSRTVKEGSEGC